MPSSIHEKPNLDGENTLGYYTQQEILSQPQVWAQALKTLKSQTKPLEEFLKSIREDTIVFTGCGSTYYLSLAAAAVFQGFNGRIARGVPASELWLYPHNSLPAKQNALLVAVSRSGETTETLRACESLLAKGNKNLLTLSCYPEAPLAQIGTLNLIFPMAQEKSVAQTRAFSTLYLATLGLKAIGAGQPALMSELAQLPEAGQEMLNQYRGLAHELGSNPKFERFYFLGSGIRYGLVCELSLKMKEMSLSHSEPFHFMEFRHGPISMINSQTLVIGLLSKANYLHEKRVLDEARALGAQVVEVGENGVEAAFPIQLSEEANSILGLLFGQMLAFERAVGRGLNPDQPHCLESVVKL